MSERLTVLFEDRQICAFELMDGAGQYDEELRRTLRFASQDGRLICPDCKKRMILCAGAVVQPYFRHFELEDCQYSAALRTVSRKRTYKCRQTLFNFIRNKALSNPSFEEKKNGSLFPILFDVEGGKRGYVYLDGKTRNYRELEDTCCSYDEQGIKLYFFLNIRFESKANNITSDEAECRRLNGGEIYYLDEEKKQVKIRRKYSSATGEPKDFQVVYDIDKLYPDADGRITGEFLLEFEKVKKEEKRRIWKVIRIAVEEGIDEEYLDYDYVLMDSIGEIWVLPFFPYSLKDSRNHNENRIAFLQNQNEYFFQLDEKEREYHAKSLIEYILARKNSWEYEI